MKQEPWDGTLERCNTGFGKRPGKRQDIGG